MTARTTTTLPSTVLTRQEKAVLDLLCEGMSNQEIAAELVVSVRTATTHLCNISDKLQLSGRVKLVLYWQANRPA